MSLRYHGAGRLGWLASSGTRVHSLVDGPDSAAWVPWISRTPPLPYPDEIAERGKPTYDVAIPLFIEPSMYRPGIGEVELPNEIERALEEQRLVFFCGAGISVYTGLPLFKGLVKEVFRKTYRPIKELVGDDLEPAKAAFCASQYDRALAFWSRR